MLDETAASFRPVLHWPVPHSSLFTHCARVHGIGRPTAIGSCRSIRATNASSVRPCHPSLDALPESLAGRIDMIDVFRRTEDVMPIAGQAIAIGAPVLWQQPGVVDVQADALVRAQAPGLPDSFTLDVCQWSLPVRQRSCGQRPCLDRRVAVRASSDASSEELLPRWLDPRDLHKDLTARRSPCC